MRTSYPQITRIRKNCKYESKAVVWVSMQTEVLIYILSGLLVILGIWIARLEIRLKRLLAGKDARTLENTIVRLRDELSNLFDYKKGNELRMQDHDERIRRNVAWVETIRFNPFAGQGGNQSWSTLLLNEKGDGVVLAGLWGRDKSSVYAKPIRNGTSDHELSAEEQELIA